MPPPAPAQQQPKPHHPPGASNNKKKRKRSHSEASSTHPPARGSLPPSTALPSSSLPPPTTTTKKKPLPPYPYPTEYADHFETPACAYRDLEPVLYWVARALGKKDKAKLRVYDPYYCAGAVKTLLKNLGFAHVLNQMRDFYADVAQGTVPPHDVLVTNPPYSGDHKERILQFCLASGKPWCLLLPNYVANKAYYTDAIAQLPPTQQPFYLVPSTKYDYAHPQGTGHETSPFFSVWYCSTGTLARDDKRNPLLGWLDKAGKKHVAPHWRLVTSVDGLRSSGAAPSWKRPSNKRRKKMQRLSATSGPPHLLGG